MDRIETEINKINFEIDSIVSILKKSFKDWTEEDINLYGSEEQEARKRLRMKEEQLRKEKEQQTELLILKQKALLLQSEQSPRIAGTATHFYPAQYHSNQIFPFFDSTIEQYLKHFGEAALLDRDDAIEKVNQIISMRVVEKYQPIICSTSRGMGKTAFMEAIGMQLVKPHLKNQLILDALKYGGIISFDFASDPYSRRYQNILY